jgi:Transposase DDE domain group 1
MRADDPPRLGVTSLAAPTPQRLYAALNGARGHGANASKAVPPDLHSARTSAPTCLAHALRLLLACAADVLQQALRTPPLPPTALAPAHPSTVLLTLCTGAAQGKQY